jgi:uncharacterized membrane-anchored protein YitT (DUF2179 family)
MRSPVFAVLLLVIALGLGLLVAGVALLSIPAALIVGGLIVVGAGALFLDFDVFGGERE